MQTITSTTVTIRSDRNLVEERIREQLLENKVKLKVKPIVKSYRGLQFLWEDLNLDKHK